MSLAGRERLTKAGPPACCGRHRRHHATSWHSEIARAARAGVTVRGCLFPQLSCQRKTAAVGMFIANTHEDITRYNNEIQLSGEQSLESQGAAIFGDTSIIRFHLVATGTHAAIQ